MSKHAYALFVLVFGIALLPLSAQTPPCDRPTYDEFIAKAQNLIEAGDYIQAFQYYNSAKDYCPHESAAVDELVGQLIAIIAEDQQATVKAKQQAEKALLLAEKAEKRAIASQKLTEDALDKANKLIGAFYFYADRYALTYGQTGAITAFYFIDKNGDEVKQLGKWRQALPFDYSGYANVTGFFGEKYLLDTLGNRFRVAYNLSEINAATKALDLRGTRLNAFPRQILGHTQLEIIILTGDADILSPDKKPISLPSNINRLTQLRSLQIHDFRLKELPENIGLLTNLERLDLGLGNDLKYLPESFAQLSELRHLDLGSNQLEALPKQFSDLSNLIVLELDGSNLVGLPHNFDQLKKLKYLNLASNKLSQLPTNFGALSSLEYLDLEFNKLDRLPQSFSKLTQLKHLDLTANELAHVPESISQLSNLSFLDLSGNWEIPLQDLHLLVKRLVDTEVLLSDAKGYAYLANKAFNTQDYATAFDRQYTAVQIDSLNYDYWYSLSFFSLFVEEYATAIEAAEKTLKLNSGQTGVETNLALGYLLNDQWKEATTIYKKRRGQQFPGDPNNRSWNQVFLQDIADLEAAGITHPDFAKVKALLEE